MPRRTIAGAGAARTAATHRIRRLRGPAGEAGPLKPRPSLRTAPRLALGTYPTPVQHLAPLSSEHAALWIKRDDLTNPVYGGNKVRKLEGVLGEILARGYERVVTVGATGSHHVLATTYFGLRAGLEVEAVLVPQPETEHTRDVLRASLAQGLRAFRVRSYGAAVAVLAWRVVSGAHLVTVGGSSVAGAMGYVAAARELAAQVRAGEIPEPDVCVVALGSGGTAAGLAAGFEAEGLRTRVVGVCVSQPPWAARLLAIRLARACARRTDMDQRRVTARQTRDWLRDRLVVETSFLGPGYGLETQAALEASREAETLGLKLDPTYTAKTFACALSLVRSKVLPGGAAGATTPTAARTVLYWHTLSSAPMQPLLSPARIGGD
jgi:1-aminocyclopropane-1-carboxylate deaminase/D-cysteine desulfhydrase-like pyridoxal-dependent ACC family enzyme